MIKQNLLAIGRNEVVRSIAIIHRENGIENSSRWVGFMPRKLVPIVFSSKVSGKFLPLHHFLRGATDPLRLLAGCGNFVEKFVSVYRQMVQVTTSLKNLSAVRNRVCVPVAHSTQNFDLVVESFGDGGR